MVSLLFRELTHLIHKLQRFTKVGKSVVLLEVMFVNDFPAVELRAKSVEFLALKRRHAAAARHTFFAG
jgi:hypothetical protein